VGLGRPALPGLLVAAGVVVLCAAPSTRSGLTAGPADTMVFSLYVSAVALVVPLVAFPLGHLVRRRSR
jgi:hypothetical protein